MYLEEKKQRLSDLAAEQRRLTEDVLVAGGVLDRARALLDVMPVLSGVGVSAAHCEKTLRLFVQEAEAFLARGAAAAESQS